MLVIMVIGAAVFLVSALNSSALQIKRDKITADALAQAKEALIGYAVGVNFTGGAERPGDLPCPDTNNDGIAETACGNASGSTGQNLRLGRLPWKTLGLPDLRDGSGERLWYAVSNNFKEKTHTALLNSDTSGTITIRAPDGSLLNDGSGANGVVAVIIAPGNVLQRQGASSPQNRSCTIGVDCDAAEKCTSTPPTLTPKCDPVNYLDSVAAEDNANFIDVSPTNGFIQGVIKNHDPVTNSDYVILNDQLLVVTYDNIMQPMQKRVAAEVKQCLTDYAAQGQNMGLYPWPAKLDASAAPNYDDVSDTFFGRLPDTFANTVADSGGAMKNGWTTLCNLNLGSWWNNWREMVFYGLADAYKPDDPPITPAANACNSAGECLRVNPPSAMADKKFVVILAGKKLGGQLRNSNANKGTLNNYLENPNNGGATSFALGIPSTTFNDTVVFQ
jgi:hypothetical protein